MSLQGYGESIQDCCKCDWFLAVLLVKKTTLVKCSRRQVLFESSKTTTVLSANQLWSNHLIPNTFFFVENLLLFRALLWYGHPWGNCYRLGGSPLMTIDAFYRQPIIIPWKNDWRFANSSKNIKKALRIWVAPKKGKLRHEMNWVVFVFLFIRHFDTSPLGEQHSHPKTADVTLQEPTYSYKNYAVRLSSQKVLPRGRIRAETMELSCANINMSRSRSQWHQLQYITCKSSSHPLTIDLSSRTGCQDKHYIWIERSIQIYKHEHNAAPNVCSKAQYRCNSLA